MWKVNKILHILNKPYHYIPTPPDKPKYVYTIFEDNHSCIEIVKIQRMNKRSKHIAIKYHHYYEKVLQ